MKLQRIARSDRMPRHEHRVRTFSRDYDLIRRVGDRIVVDGDGAETLIAWVCIDFGVPFPNVVPNSRRRVDTGQCWPPRWHVADRQGIDRVEGWEAARRRTYPDHGEIRIGTTTLLRTVAHELGHHLVHYLDPARTPAHGKVWVGRFDDAMAAITRRI